MATTRWRGGAAAVAQATDFVFAGTWEATDVITVTIGSKSASTTAGSTATATVVSALVTWFNALDASIYPEMAELTASAPGSSTTFRLTGDTEGKPFSVTISTTETGGGAADAQTIDGAASSTGTASTAASGPNFWSVAANWSGGAVPVTGDTVHIEHSGVDILYGLSQGAVTLAALHVDSTFTGSIGLPETNADGEEYPEYRDRYLVIGATLAYVGRGEGQGSDRIKLDNSNIQTALQVLGTGGGEADLPALLWKGTHASNVVNVIRGSVGIAVFGGETATVATLRAGWRDSEESDASVRAGSGLALTTLVQLGGDVELLAGLTTVTKTSGSLRIAAGNVTTWTDQDGESFYDGTGTIGTLKLGTDASMDFGGESQACTVTNAVLLNAGASLIDRGSRATFSAGFKTADCTLEEVTVDLGPNRTYTPS